MTQGKPQFRLLAVDLIQGKPQFRLLAVDLILNSITLLDDTLGNESSWGVKCLEALLERCLDSTAGIRARAITNMAQIVAFLSGNDENKAGLMKIMGFSEDGGINDLLRKRCVDEKAAVRKSALVLISKLTALHGEGGGFDDMLLKITGVACSDQLVSIRKAAISALSETFRKFDDENVTKKWLHSVPHLITDNETSIQEECENLFLELVVDRVSREDPMSLSNGVLYLRKKSSPTLCAGALFAILKACVYSFNTRARRMNVCTSTLQSCPNRRSSTMESSKTRLLLPLLRQLLTIKNKLTGLSVVNLWNLRDYSCTRSIPTSEAIEAL